jgi:hypothetical protein
MKGYPVFHQDGWAQEWRTGYLPHIKKQREVPASRLSLCWLPRAPRKSSHPESRRLQLLQAPARDSARRREVSRDTTSGQSRRGLLRGTAGGHGRGKSECQMPDFKIGDRAGATWNAVRSCSHRPISSLALSHIVSHKGSYQGTTGFGYFNVFLFWLYGISEAIESKTPWTPLSIL